MATTILIWVIFILIVGGAFVVYHQNIERWVDTFPHKRLKKVPYEPEPILPLYEGQLEALVQAILDERTQNPRLFRDSQFRTSWNREFRRLNLPNDQIVYKARDAEDLATIRDWQGNILRQDLRTKRCEHDHTMCCYRCERI